eukprot:TRINITY_DN31982_c0_g1_i1.p1 TRINITY_DN31982_c0_g1~~TRINITY_DN31982_c0_g1_i1.p1  ORF type:complete len:917 (+),score=226.88 TRINITY_DN31982_c0_g1_i1:139-2889(+)
MAPPRTPEIKSVPPSGLSAAETIKANLHSTGDEELIIDEVVWKQNVLDLHRVMEISKTMWLAVEHSNEACCRVGLEIALCRRSKKVLFWPDFWFSDHDKREHFKQIVNMKLAIAMANAKGGAVDFSGFADDEGESEEVKQLKLRIAELEAALKAARAAQAAAELAAREAQEAAANAMKRLGEMEKAMDQLRQQVRDGMSAPVEVKDDGSADEIKRLQGLLKMSDDKIKSLEAEIAALKKKLQEPKKEETVKDVKDNSSELAMANRRIAELEEQIKKLRDEIRGLKNQKPVAETKVKAPKAVASGVEDELRGELEAAAQREADLQEQLRKALEEIDRLKKEIAEAKKKAAELEANLQAALANQGKGGPVQIIQAPEEKEETDTGLSAAQLAELAELRKRALEADKWKAKYEKMKAKAQSLEAELEALNEEHMKLLKMFKQVKEQLRILMELAEKKGLGDLIKKLFEEAGLTDTMNDPEYTCFDRLYDDALRRQEKQRRIEWLKLGGVGDPPPSFQGKKWDPYKRKASQSPSRNYQEVPTSGEGGDNTGRRNCAVCKNCGFPIPNAVGPPRTPTADPAPEPEKKVEQASSRPSSVSPPPGGGYRSSARDEKEFRSTWQAGQKSNERWRMGPQNYQQPRHGRSPSPQTAHALDIRIQMTRSGGPDRAGIAAVTFAEQEPWDHNAGSYGLGQLAAPLQRPNTTVQPRMQMRGRLDSGYHGEGPINPPITAQSAGTIGLGALGPGPLDGIGVHGRGDRRSRSPQSRAGRQGPRTSPGSRQLVHSASEAGELPPLAESQTSPKVGRVLVGSNSAAELRRGDNTHMAFGEAALPTPWTGVHSASSNRMRGCMLVENPRPRRYGDESMDEFAPRLMWRPHRQVAADVPFPTSKGGNSYHLKSIGSAASIGSGATGRGISPGGGE